MRYILLIYSDEKAIEGKSQEEMAAEFGAWSGYTEELRKSENMLGGEALEPTMTATTVRAAESRTITSDGPFAETKEQLGWYYLIDVKDLDEALEWAAKMPNIPWGGAVEVRPIQVFEQQQ